MAAEEQIERLEREKSDASRLAQLHSRALDTQVLIHGLCS